MTEITELGTKLMVKDASPVQHNWLYSVVPEFTPEITGIYLVGYCKQCRQAFTVRLESDAKSLYTHFQQLDIPKWGCVPIE